MRDVERAWAGRRPLGSRSVAIIAGAAAAALVGISTGQGLPAVPVPPENPITEAKRVLGKMLFWEAQLSSDNSISCGSCHIEGWVDPNWGRHPGSDGVRFTDDDILGSTGVIASDQKGVFTPDPLFGLREQVTPRVSPPPILAMYATDLFWDGRARARFVDPMTGATVISSRGALESQAVGPILNEVEMAHSGRDWDSVAAKLERARPLALATDLPSDVREKIAKRPSYPELFTDAFGDDEITAVRIAMAIATYERTLVPDQTPWDLGTMNGVEQDGWQAFYGSKCRYCHTPPLFSDYTFRNTGLRPMVEDLGRAIVTRNPNDAGKFKVPSLRQVGQRNRFMHNGMLRSLDDVFDFYAHRNGRAPLTQNRDPLLDEPIVFEPAVEWQVKAFLSTGLRDIRVFAGRPPFDRPKIHTELPPNPSIVAAGTPGTSGIVPEMLTPGTPNIGNDSFRFGIHGALGGAPATLTIHRTLGEAESGTAAVITLGPVPLVGDGAGEGYGTVRWPVPDEAMADTAYAVWTVDDPGGDGPVRSPVVRLVFYREDPTSCGGCRGDLNCDQTVGFQDIVALLDRWGECGLCGADLNDDGLVGFQDIIVLLDNWGGC